MQDYDLISRAGIERKARELGITLPWSENISILAQPVQAGALVIPNSLAVHPMEGADGDDKGQPGELTCRRYERFGGGGAGLLWAEAIAVVPEGRANPRQLWLHEGSMSAFAAMLHKSRSSAANSMGADYKPIIVAQLTHSGRYSKPGKQPQPIIPQRDPYRDMLRPEYPPTRHDKTNIPEDWPLVTDAYLDDLIAAYVKAARRAFAVGFDAVDIKSCHGYLINELFACHNRPGKYGGTFDNRTRLLLNIVDAIRNEIGEGAAITMRLGIYDAIPYPYGWGVDKNDYLKPDLSEPKKLIGLLAERGIKMLNVTFANPYYNPHYGRPFNEPIVGGYPSPEHPLEGVARMLNLTAQVQRAFPEMAMVGTGYSWLRNFMANVGAAMKLQGDSALIGGGRGAFAYPDFAKDILTKGRLDPNKVCIACSGCTQIMRDDGMTGCVVRDNEVYGPIYQHGRLSNRDNLLRLAQLCRKCEQPNCRCACPAGVNIPKFINLFLDGKDKEAYESIRESNVFAEICGWLCPVETLCEGSCLQRFIGDGALPIAAIQRYLAKRANENGWSKLRIPTQASGKRIAVLGTGPAGLSCTVRLLEAGHIVVLYNKQSTLGGMIYSVIPAQRVGSALKREIDAVFNSIPFGRLIMHSGVSVSKMLTIDDIMAQGYDACFIGLGLSQAVTGSDKQIQGIWDALRFLEAAKHQDLQLNGKRVVVVGGGNTALDAAVTAKKLGARDVYVMYRRSFEEMPAWPGERERAMQLGIHFLILTQQLEYGIGKDGVAAAVKACPTKLGEPDASGRRRPIAMKDSAYTLDMDIVVEAIGQQTPEELKDALPGIKFDQGLIAVDENYRTSRLNIFAGGDIVHGAATVVAAVADGMRAAQAINEYLNG